MKFDVRQTNIVKGTALLLLLCHHLFLTTADRYISVLMLGDVPFERLFAEYGKCCVAMFMFCSGYGLYKSYTAFLQKRQDKPIWKTDIVFVKNRLLKLLANYWVVFILFVPLGLLFGRRFYEIYGSDPLHYLADIFGVSYLFYDINYTMNATWWYMGIIILYYLLFPLLMKPFMRLPTLVTAIAIAIAFLPLHLKQTYLGAFLLGAYFANKALFEKVDKVLHSLWLKIPLLLVMLAVVSVVRFHLNQISMLSAMRFDAIYVIPVILICYLLLSRVKVLGRFLEALGQKSGLIFLFHTFITYYYFRDLLFSVKQSTLIFVIALAVCWLIAWLLEWLMKITGYQKLVKKLTS